MRWSTPHGAKWRSASPAKVRRKTFGDSISRALTSTGKALYSQGRVRR